MPLMQAERAWAYAMQQKHEMKDDRDRSRFHLIRRLTKAAFWSSQLHQLCSERADARTALEAEVSVVLFEVRRCQVCGMKHLILIPSLEFLLQSQQLLRDVGGG